MSSHKIRTRLLPGDQGQAFQTHSLQIVLFGPLYIRAQRHSWVVKNRVPTIYIDIYLLPPYDVFNTFIDQIPLPISSTKKKNFLLILTIKLLKKKSRIYSSLENYWILWEYHKCVLPPFTWIMGPTINLISETHSYVKMESMHLWYFRSTQ